MPIGIDMSVILAPTSIDERAIAFSDNDWTFGTAAREGDWCTIDIELGRAVGIAAFQVEISVNDRPVAVRVPAEMVDGRLTLERVHAFQRIRDTDDDPPNVLRIRSLSTDSYWVRSIVAMFHQDF